MYTPAVTIVAAWISALTGVGPSIASGSHTNSGICALLPVAPTNSSSAVRLSTPNTPVSGANRADPSASFTSVNRRDPASVHRKNIPRMKPASPIRFTMNALLAASEALFLWK